MRYKEGVSRKSLQPTMSLAVNEINKCFEKIDKEFVITSTYDGKHKKGSLHYIGLAIDFRNRHLSDKEQSELMACIRSNPVFKNDKRFQFLPKKTHIHVEYDRREN